MRDYLRKLAKALRTVIEAVLLILFAGACGAMVGGAGAMAGGSLDANFLPKDTYSPAQVSRSLMEFVFLGVGIGEVLGLLFGVSILLPPFFGKAGQPPIVSENMTGHGPKILLPSPHDTAV